MIKKMEGRKKVTKKGITKKNGLILESDRNEWFTLDKKDMYM